MQGKLVDPKYMSFPFRVNQDGIAVSERREHIREQIAQVLFTNPTERVFRLAFGAGVRRLVFEPNNAGLWDLARQRLASSLGDALRGEVDPASLVIERLDEDSEDTLHIYVAYRLATINRLEEHIFRFQGGSDG